MARPRVYSDAQVIAALKKKKGLVYLAAQSLGCSPDTIRNRAKAEPTVAACLADQRGLVIDKAEDKLFLAVQRGDPWAIGLLLKTLGKDRGYFERSDVRTTSVVAKTKLNLGKLPDDDLTNLVAILRRAAELGGSGGGTGEAPPA